VWLRQRGMQLLSFSGETSAAGISLEKDLALRAGNVFINYCMSMPRKAMVVFNTDRASLLYN
jgi:hypothetical protein